MRVAERRLPAVADVQRPGRIGGHEFDHHALARRARARGRSRSPSRERSRATTDWRAAGETKS